MAEMPSSNSISTMSVDDDVKKTTRSKRKTKKAE